MLGTSFSLASLGVGVSLFGAAGAESTAAKKSSDSSLTDRAFGWVDSSDGRVKSPGRTEDVSAPPITLPSCSIAALCQILALMALVFLGGPIKQVNIF